MAHGVAWELLSGWVAGSFGVLITQPIDTIRVRIQHSSSGEGIYAIIRSTFANEGMRGMFKGLASPAMTCGLINTTLFFGYTSADRFLLEYDAFQHNYTRAFMAGCVAGVPCSFLNCPAELVKCKVQVNRQSVGRLKEEFMVFRTLLWERNLFRGQLVTLVRDLPSYGSYFWSYQLFLSVTESTFFAGGFAGMLCWSVIYPIDVFKTVHQTSAPSASYADSLAILAHSRGIFRGFTTTLFKAWPQNGAVFVVYEAFMNFGKTPSQI